MPKDYTSEINAWRADIEERLRRPYSWLSLAGLFWLQNGDNDFGSAAGNAVRLPARAPRAVGFFRLQGNQVTLVSKAPARVNESELLTGMLKADTSGAPDYVYIDDIRIGVIERSGRFAIRVWDPQHANRQNFGGQVWWPPDAAARVEARIERYDPPKDVMIEDMVGTVRPSVMHAALHFEWRGQPCSLDAEMLDDGSYDLLFKDATAGKGSYPAGRFLTTEIAEGDKVMIDFNKAYSPPCAFTDFATCPLPLPQNILSVAIEAGEKYIGSDDSPQRH